MTIDVMWTYRHIAGRMYTDVSVYIKGFWLGSRYHGALSKAEITEMVKACLRRNNAEE